MKTFEIIFTFLGTAVLLGHKAAAYTVNKQGLNALSTCAAPPSDAEVYDYIIVGSGAGGGPLAASLAEKGFKVGLIDAGHDVTNFNTSLPMFFPKSNEDPQLELGYHVNLYTDKSSVSSTERTVQDWYPRGSALGGSTIHNALINVLQMKWDFDNIASITGIASWGASSMYNYFKKIENNHYIPSTSITGPSHGYSGWMETNEAPEYLMEGAYTDPQLSNIFNALAASGDKYPGVDINAVQSEGLTANGVFPMTSKTDKSRSSVRDRLVAVQSQYPENLTFKLDTMVTKLLLCKSGSGSNISAVAYGVQISTGASLLPVAALYKGKKALASTQVYARYEVIVSTGTFQTPQLLQLSGLGPTKTLQNFGLPTIVDLPGVGENLQDRLEMSVLYNLKSVFQIYHNCTFGNTPTADPCLQQWVDGNHENLYSAGAAVWVGTSKSSPKAQYADTWVMHTPSSFHGYYPGYAVDLTKTGNVFGTAILKGHAAATGWVHITGSDPQDPLDINKNLFSTPQSIADRTAVRETVKSLRKLFTTTPNISQYIVSERYPGPDVVSDDQIDSFINVNGWGHHACCTAKIGVATDSAAVVNGDFQVYGVSNLRIVDNSVWPVIPGLFVTTPIYMISEKAADVISAYAATKSWSPTP